VLASSYNRREELREATKSVIDEEHWRSFFFGTMLMPQPQAFGGSSWIDLTDRETSIVFEADDRDDEDVEEDV
jgi:hypothetical protein